MTFKINLPNRKQRWVVLLIGLSLSGCQGLLRGSSKPKGDMCSPLGCSQKPFDGTSSDVEGSLSGGKSSKTNEAGAQGTAISETDAQLEGSLPHSSKNDAGGQLPGTPDSPAPTAFDVKKHILETAEGAKSEAPPYGVPSNWSWVIGSTETTVKYKSNYTHANFWGAIFRGLSNSTPSNTMVELRNCSFWLLYDDQTTWEKIDAQGPELGGGSFTPTYGGGTADPDLQLIATGARVIPAPGNIWHFWPQSGYTPIRFDHVREALSNCLARLVQKNPQGADDRQAADYLIHMGADWRDPNDPPCANNGYVCMGFGASKMYKITTQWRNCTFHTLTAADLQNNLPLPPGEIFTFPAD